MRLSRGSNCCRGRGGGNQGCRTFGAGTGAQLLTYLRLGGWKVGLLINFNNAPSSSCAKCASKFLRPFPCCVKAFAGAYWDLKSKPLSSLRLRGYWENAEARRNASPEFRSGSLSPLLDKTTTTCSSYFLTVPWMITGLAQCGQSLRLPNCARVRPSRE